jgi:hypothetical protein
MRQYDKKLDENDKKTECLCLVVSNEPMSDVKEEVSIPEEVLEIQEI